MKKNPKKKEKKKTKYMSSNCSMLDSLKKNLFDAKL